MSKYEQVESFLWYGPRRVPIDPPLDVDPDAMDDGALFAACARYAESRTGCRWSHMYTEPRVERHELRVIVSGNGWCMYFCRPGYKAAAQAAHDALVANDMRAVRAAMSRYVSVA